jgi:hypothetical protein
MDDRELLGSQVTLPSLGIPYGGKSEVTILPTTTKEEKMLTSAGPNSGLSIVDTLIARCVRGLGEDVTPDQLLVGDRNYLMLAIRAVGFGKEYQYQVDCPSCKQIFVHKVDLPDDVDVVSLKKGFQEPFEVTLPVSGTKLELRLLRGSDEKEIQKYEEKIYRHVNVQDAGDPSYDFRRARHVVRLTKKDGTVIENNSEEATMQIIAIMQDFVSRDNVEFRNCLSENDCGVDSELQYQCPKCSNVFTKMLPMTIEFFRPGGNRGIRYL